MKFILNIGANRSDDGELFPGGRVTRDDVIMCLRAARFDVLHVEQHLHADRESTYVAVAEHDAQYLFTSLNAVSRALDQDCIAAAWYVDAQFVGELVGPRANEWGKFNPAMFDLPKAYEV